MNNPAINPEEVASETVTNSTETKPSESGRGEVSAQTIARMMGLTTSSDLNLLDGKLDLLISRIGTVSVRLDKFNTTLQQSPTVNDMERIDVQIGSLRSSMRELLLALKAMVGDTNPEAAALLKKSETSLETTPEGFDKK